MKYQYAWEEAWFAKQRIERQEQTGKKQRECLDILGLALANENHTWSPEERKAYEVGVVMAMA